MNSAKDYYNFWAKTYPSAVSWEKLDKEVREHWETHWQATKERMERMRGNSPD
jgi:hypothetical protein